MKRKLIWCRWRDAAASSHRYLKEGEPDNPLIIFESSGFLVSDNKDALTIAVDWDDNERSWRGIMGIPQECIVKKKVINVEV